MSVLYFAQTLTQSLSETEPTRAAAAGTDYVPTAVGSKNSLSHSLAFFHSLSLSLRAQTLFLKEEKKKTLADWLHTNLMPKAKPTWVEKKYFTRASYTSFPPSPPLSLCLSLSLSLSLPLSKEKGREQTIKEGVKKI